MVTRWLPALLVLAGCVEPISLFEADGGAADAGAHSSGVTDVSAAFFHSCAIRDGRLFCWGENTEGALGVGDRDPRSLPTQVGTATTWLQVSCGYGSTCALDASGAVWCWGANDEAQLGAGDGPSVLQPQRVALVPIARLSSRFSHACAIGQDGSLWCWGANLEGQLGLADAQPFVNRPTPQSVAAGTQWRDVSTGGGHTCGIQQDGSLWCWGRNAQRQLGLGAGAAGQVRRPTRVGTASDWVDVEVGGATSCGVRTGGALSCWGQVYESMPLRNEQAPVAISATVRGASISAETFGACAVEPDSTLACWGRNFEGQLGLGDTTSRLEPTEVGPETWKRVAVGRFHRCAIDSQDRLWCNGEGGRLGLGDTTRRRVATPVRSP